jgi:integrase
MQLTKAIVDRAQYEGTPYRGKDGKKKWPRYTLWDHQIKGLGVRVTRAGVKTFVLSYRAKGRTKRLMKLGRFGEMTLTEARQRARRLLVQIADGKDPLAIRGESRKVLTVRELGQRYLTEHAIPKKKPDGSAEDARKLRVYIYPAIGALPVEDVRREHIHALHHSMRATPTTANRTVALLSKMFNLAEAWGLRMDATNPTRHLQRYKERPRERYLTREELDRLGEVLRQIDAEGSETPQAVAAIRLLLLTGCRKGEILTLQWQHIDFQRGLIHFQDTKTGNKTVPLSPAVQSILEQLPRFLDNPYVLPGRYAKGHLIGLNHIWQRIREQANVPDLKIHDLRHSFASFGAGGGLGLPIIGKLLGHRNVSTTARYAHLADDPVRIAAEQVSGEISRAL